MLHFQSLFRLFQELETEKQKTLQELYQRQSEAVKLSQEKQEMSEYTTQLQLNLKKIEDRTQLLKDEKRMAEDTYVHSEYLHTKLVCCSDTDPPKRACSQSHGLKQITAYKSCTALQCFTPC